MAVEDSWVSTGHSTRSVRVRRGLGALYRLLDRSPARFLLRFPAIEHARHRVTATTVSGPDAVRIVRTLAASGVQSWLSGGWACDALLGEQTRPHADLDLVVTRADTRHAVEILERHGFVQCACFDAMLQISVIELIDRRHRRRIGLHVIDANVQSAGSWPGAELREAVHVLGLNPDELLTTGVIDGHEIPSVSASVLLALHTGYDPQETDRHDVQRLCSRFALPAPPGYASPADGV